MPDTPETRLARLERDSALLTQRLEDLRQRVGDLTLTATTVIELKISMGGLQSELANVRRDIEERDKDAVADRRANRTAIYGMTTAIMATIVGAVITLLIAGVGH